MSMATITKSQLRQMIKEAVLKEQKRKIPQSTKLNLLFDDLSPLFEYVAIAYPPHILKRRLSNLNENQIKMINSIKEKIGVLIESIDNVINSANQNDPWE